MKSVTVPPGELIVVAAHDGIGQVKHVQSIRVRHAATGQEFMITRDVDMHSLPLPKKGDLYTIAVGFDDVARGD